ncbi:hypothetical protein CHS0354_028588 [Potamilus streckersoni]|uniref:Uncharacterized protein n=1 Tax=Potamilus streckersoni TaxID=2493646 RepID=A0AAE0VYB1_9BIVA|nr:hypothetical protein CHS0354_028588 [Potamilus streckersoni]
MSKLQQSSEAYATMTAFPKKERSKEVKKTKQKHRRSFNENIDLKKNKPTEEGSFNENTEETKEKEKKKHRRSFKENKEKLGAVLSLPLPSLPRLDLYNCSLGGVGNIHGQRS